MYETMPPGYYSPQVTPQQRLAMMEQAYPQFTSAYNPYMVAAPGAGQAQVAQPQRQQQMYYKCRPVSSIDEVRGCMIELDGTLNVFTDLGHNRIYTKQVGLDGNAPIKTYVLEEEQAQHLTISGAGADMEKKDTGFVTVDMLGDIIENQIQDMVQSEVEKRLSEYM